MAAPAWRRQDDEDDDDAGESHVAALHREDDEDDGSEQNLTEFPFTHAELSRMIERLTVAWRSIHAARRNHHTLGDFMSVLQQAAQEFEHVFLQLHQPVIRHRDWILSQSVYRAMIAYRGDVGGQRAVELDQETNAPALRDAVVQLLNLRRILQEALPSAGMNLNNFLRGVPINYAFDCIVEQRDARTVAKSSGSFGFGVKPAATGPEYHVLTPNVTILTGDVLLDQTGEHIAVSTTPLYFTMRQESMPPVGTEHTFHHLRTRRLRAVIESRIDDLARRSPLPNIRAHILHLIDYIQAISEPQGSQVDVVEAMVAQTIQNLQQNEHVDPLNNLLDQLQLLRGGMLGSEKARNIHTMHSAATSSAIVSQRQRGQQFVQSGKESRRERQSERRRMLGASYEQQRSEKTRGDKWVLELDRRRLQIIDDLESKDMDSIADEQLMSMLVSIESTSSPEHLTTTHESPYASACKIMYSAIECMRMLKIDSESRFDRRCSFARDVASVLDRVNEMHGTETSVSEYYVDSAKSRMLGNTPSTYASIHRIVRNHAVTSVWALISDRHQSHFAPQPKDLDLVQCLLEIYSKHVEFMQGWFDG